MEILEKLKQIVGPAHVLTGDMAAGYGRDWTGAYGSAPLAVLRPGTRDEAAAILRLAHDARLPVVPVAGNTGLAGGTFAEGALMISVERMNRIRDIRPGARVAVVEAGVILSALHDAAEAQGLIFPLFFGARGSAMIGGVLSTNAGGSNVLRYGNTRALCLGLEVVLPDGRVMDLMGALHKDNTGYDLKDLFIGAEGTLGLITAAVLKLMPKPRAHATAMVAVPALPDALMLLNRLQDETGGAVEAFEYMPADYMARLAACRPDLRPPFATPHAVNILVEVGATAPRDATPLPDGSLPVVTHLEETLAAMMADGAVLDAVVARSEAQRAEIWERREAAAEITFSRGPIVDSDIALPLDGVVPFLERMQVLLPRIDPGAETITVGHLGDGNLHYAVWPSRDDAALKDAIRETVEDVVAELGGSFSAEHGIGLSKKSTMARRKDPVALAVMAQIKAALDPQGIMNPGKLLPE
ncbi:MULTISPECIES: FAD-binding oxidoreductase [Actibacterium]|uniref:FAD/FMN-containing dehydrogenase n=1 Tax=Actibacterium naphthalenivorans TaxID=1614693 RepID=A0A840CEQ5_9RHOB|nr:MULTISPECIES: FAD-binding oxidoreductase [Actibacterium]ALG91211.1 FAD-dependent oxidoreductase [Actibacterium sp. EMB200-NS6]MBB4022582.1 FAD/FMN-containing dehydrogenase [Actibacterium naphthalenivorans]